jgi:uncharacterized protein YjbI with pentapeptide repeats
MKNILFVLLLGVACSAFGFNQQDLNKLQTTCSCPHCDLTNANLSNFILGDSKTLTTKNSQGTLVCNLTGAKFDGAKLANAYFSPADFGPGISPQVGKVILKNASFKSANLSGSHFNAVIANGANFQNANLNNATFLEHSSFINSNFQNALMTNLTVRPPMGGCGAFFKHCNFSQANLSNSKINADFTQANFSNTNLSNSSLTTCDTSPEQAFQKTNFFKANLTNSTTNGSVITEALLVKAKLCQTKLTSTISNRDCAH